MNDKIDLAGLIPDFTTLGSFPETASQLSASFVAVLIIVAVFFLMLTILYLIKAVVRTRKLRSLLKNQTSTSILKNRQSLLDKANKMRTNSGHLWSEFNESLIKVGNKQDEKKLYNTLDASHFFNHSTLAPEITENRLLAAVPGFLTALGVVGTFIGLQLGLAELNIGNDVAVSEMKAGLAHVISGAKIAFMTSVWGVFLSVVFNFIEKLFEGMVRSGIRNLQNIIDDIFPRVNAEALLENIATNTYVSRETMQGLAEQIGIKMQESMVEVTSSIQSGLEASLEKIMSPAMDKLAKVASEGNEQAVTNNQQVLESLVDNFLERFGELGQTQRESMDVASQNVSDSLNSLTFSMNDFLEKLQLTENQSAEREQELIQNISTQVNSLVDNSHLQQKLLVEFVGDKLGNLSNTLQEREKISLQRDEKRQQALLSQTQSMKQTTENFLETMEEKMNSQHEAITQLLTQGEQLQGNIQKSTETNLIASQRIKDSSEKLKTSSQEMQLFGNHIKEASNYLSGQISQAVSASKDLAQGNERLSKTIEKYGDQLITEHKKFEQAITALNFLVTNADNAFIKMKTHQDNFLNSLKDNLKDNVEELSTHMTQLLKDYANRANSQTEEQLRLWAKNSTEYADKMNHAMNSFDNMLASIEDQLNNLR